MLLIINWFWKKPHLILTCAALGWGGYAVAARTAIGEVSPLLLMQLRWSLCSLILLGIYWKQIIVHWPAVKKRWRYVWLMGGAGLAGFTSLFSLGAQHTSAINLGIAQGAIPAFVMLLGLLLYRTAIGCRQFVGLLLSLAGVAVLITSGNLSALSTLEVNDGDLIMVGACFCYAFYVLHLGKRLDMPPAIMLAFFSFFALITLTFLTAGEYASGQLIWPSSKGWLIIFYVAVFPTILSQTFFMRGVELLGANRAGFYVNLVPIFAAFMSVMLLSETMQSYHIVALIMVLSGIILAEKHKVQKPI